MNEVHVTILRAGSTPQTVTVQAGTKTVAEVTGEFGDTAQFTSAEGRSLNGSDVVNSAMFISVGQRKDAGSN